MELNQIILGISYLGNDTSASLIIDGDVVSCCEEERYNYQKHTRSFPQNAIEDCLTLANLKIDDVDIISLGFDPDLYWNYEYVDKINRRALPTRAEVTKQIQNKLNFSKRVMFFEHHLCHAASAFYSSGYQESLIISNDGIGEVTSSLVAMGRENQIDKLFEENFFPNSLGLAYSAITKYLGWGSGDEGIVMGLAPLGNYSEIVPGQKFTYEEAFSEMIQVDNFKYTINQDWFAFPKVRDKWVTDKFVGIFGPWREKDGPITDHTKNIASALQNRIETIIIDQLMDLKKLYSSRFLCVSGGLGLNCSLNGKIESKGLFDEIYIPAASGDNGISLGSAFLAHHATNKSTTSKKITSFSLGSRFSEMEIEKALLDRKLEYSKPDNFYESVAHEINNKKIVGWFQGGAEFGPRALGNRSIIASASTAEMKDHVNKRVKFRESFRPFAPAVLEEFANDFFEIKQKSPFMLMASQVKSDKINEIPAVVHVDQSARLQTVNSIDNNEFYELISSYYAITKCPVIMNTSFNVKGQPIVNNPTDAIETFLSTNIDVLAIGPFVVKK